MYNVNVFAYTLSGNRNVVTLVARQT